MKSNEFSFRDREIAIAGLVGGVLYSGREIHRDAYPSLLPHELRVLLRFWIKVAVDIDYYRFLTGNVDTDDLHGRDLAWERVDAIRKVLGLEEEERTLAEVREELGRYEDPRYWNVFWDGTDAEKKTAQKEARRLEYERTNKGVV